ncbi:glycosyl transferase family 2 [Candidatus Scalindua japonica]|uniref:Glycosyl transferase family 2 n=1 Tax=Candidatus Scalindua japonica TaxID=1284222 RepID=A0A286TTE6_9BACT|nr:glycosyltransferase family 2 protein [Candidatus Scalindua japonica]GAX59189.1 glycosyl transferase family 2 [Candidatus Scalindua japonica]
MSIQQKKEKCRKPVNEVITTENTIISIVIVNYMTKELLSDCLKSIFREDYKRNQIIVVDNNSTDGSAEMVEEDYPTVHLIKNKENVGFAKANNIAIKHAIGEYILLLNPDTELTDSTIEKLVGFMEKDTSVSACGCMVLYPDGRIQISCGYFPSFSSACLGGQSINMLYRKIFPNSNFLGACGITPEALNSIQEVETLLGACVMIRREVLEQVGLFDENMFLYFEECDLFYRIRKAGGKVMYTPDTKVIHHAGGSSNKNISKAVMYYQNSQEYYFIKNYSLKNIKLFKMAIMISAIIKTPFLSLMYVFCNKDRKLEQRRKIAWHWYTFLYQLKMLILQ